MGGGESARDIQRILIEAGITIIISDSKTTTHHQGVIHNGRVTKFENNEFHFQRGQPCSVGAVIFATGAFIVFGNVSFNLWGVCDF